MPDAWKRELIESLAKNPEQLDNVGDDMLVLVVEAITELLPWFPRVVTREKAGWLRNELQLMQADVHKFIEDKQG